MYSYIWDVETGGLLLTNDKLKFSKEPRPVYYRELDILEFDKYWSYPKNDDAPIMWAEANNYIYRGRTIAKTKGGSLYTPPELIVVDDSDCGDALVAVDIQKMVERNRELLETLSQETVKKAYGVYNKYRSKVDVFYVAFSGGKDSVVTLDIVSRALPHNAFVVLFGDTGMEFSDTYECAELVREQCNKHDIAFYVTKSEHMPQETWKLFGPPATTNRWCCSVHKTVPQILFLRKMLKKEKFVGMAFVGVRGDESEARSKYDYVSYGEKHLGQYSCNAILDWNSAEIFLYIYTHNLVINETYKKGNRRAGCLVCPRAAERNDYMNYHCYREEAEPFVDVIRREYAHNFESKKGLEQFINNGGWKARKNGRDLSIRVNYADNLDSKKNVEISLDHPRTDWREWIKTIGVVTCDDLNSYVMNYRDALLRFSIVEKEESIKVLVDSMTAHDYPDFVKHLKIVFRKSACCIGCQECQADCSSGCLKFVDGKVVVSDDCKHCMQCHRPDKGCLVYKSLEMPKGGVMAGKHNSLNRYSHHAPRIDWFQQYFEYKNDFETNHSLGSEMFKFFKCFLLDAGLRDSTGFSQTAVILDKLGLESEAFWGIVFVNLCYAPQMRWYVTRLEFDRIYKRSLIDSMLENDGGGAVSDIILSLGRISQLPLSNVGVGKAEYKGKSVLYFCRTSWQHPVSEVILYSLYKFAEACGGYYQFSLKTLYDETIEREGVSPTQIFGIDRKSMVGILNGLSANYPDFISASFTLDLENITLREDKSSRDVLGLL